MSDPREAETERAVDRAQQLLDVYRVSRRLGVSEEKVRRLIRDGKLQAFRLEEKGAWRITEEAYRTYVEMRQRATTFNNLNTDHS